MKRKNTYWITCKVCGINCLVYKGKKTIPKDAPKNVNVILHYLKRKKRQFCSKKCWYKSIAVNKGSLKGALRKKTYKYKCDRKTNNRKKRKCRGCKQFYYLYSSSAYPREKGHSRNIKHCSWKCRENVYKINNCINCNTPIDRISKFLGYKICSWECFQKNKKESELPPMYPTLKELREPHKSNRAIRYYNYLYSKGML